MISLTQAPLFTVSRKIHALPTPHISGQNLVLISLAHFKMHVCGLNPFFACSSQALPSCAYINSNTKQHNLDSNRKHYPRVLTATTTHRNMYLTLTATETLPSGSYSNRHCPRVIQQQKHRSSILVILTRDLITSYSAPQSCLDVWTQKRREGEINKLRSLSLMRYSDAVSGGMTKTHC